MSCCVNPKFRSTGHSTHPATLWDEQEAVGHAGRVGEDPRYSIFGVDRAGGGAANTAWDIKRGDGPVSQKEKLRVPLPVTRIPGPKSGDGRC